MGVEVLDHDLREWQAKLQSTIQENQFLRFFSIVEAQRLHRLVISSRGRDGDGRDLTAGPDETDEDGWETEPDEGGGDDWDTESGQGDGCVGRSGGVGGVGSGLVEEIALALCPLIVRSRDNFTGLCDSVGKTLRSFSFVENEDWPAQMARFLTRVFQGIKMLVSARKPVEQMQGTRRGPFIYQVRKPLRVDSLRLVLSIFKQLPEPIDILWCSKSTSAQTITSFVERAQHFLDRQFALIQVDMLPIAQQHTLLTLMLSRKNASGDEASARVPNLHCIQTGTTILQAAPWISRQIVDDEFLLAQLPGCQLKLTPATANPPESRWGELQSLVRGNGCIAAVEVLHGPAGCGKTHMAKKILHDYARKKGPWATGVISITEGFSISSTAQRLHDLITQAVINKAKGICVCFHINLGKFRESELNEWDALMDDVNRFFFALLLLHSVEDPDSGFVCNLAPVCPLHVVVEIPDRHGHLENHLLFDYWIEDLPVLAFAGLFVDTREVEYDIGDEACHVCKYLNALDNGSIDRRYTEFGQKVNSHSRSLCLGRLPG